MGPRAQGENKVMGYRVAVVGATGAVGREMLKTLAERNFPVKEVAALASGRSTGQLLSFGDKQVLTVQNLDKFDFNGWDIGLFSPGAAVSAVHAPRAEVKGRGERAQGEPWGMCGTETAGGGAGGLGRVAGDVRGGRGRGGCGEADSTAQRSKRLILARMKRGRCGVVMETSE